MSTNGPGAGAPGAAGSGPHPQPPQWAGRNFYYYQQGPPGYYLRACGGGGKKLVVGLLFGGIIGYAWASHHDCHRDWWSKQYYQRHPAFAAPPAQEGATSAAVPSVPPTTPDQPQPQKGTWN